MEPDDLLCSRNARPEKVWRKGVRRFFSLIGIGRNVNMLQPGTVVPSA